MEKRFSWKVFAQYALDNFAYKSFEEFATEMHDSIEWVDNCEGRTEEDILDNTPYAMFHGWFE